MQNAFSLFYAVLFGAILSAEIGWGVFKYDKNGKAPHAHGIVGYGLRIFFLVLCRALFFAYCYPLLSQTLNENHWIATWQLLCSLLLCLPIFGFQQLLYGLPTNANPQEVSSSKIFAWIFVILSALIVIVVLCRFRT